MLSVGDIGYGRDNGNPLQISAQLVNSHQYTIISSQISFVPLSETPNYF